MLARLWRQSEEPIAAPKPLPPAAAGYHIPQLPPSTVASNHSPKRRQKRVRVCRLYPEPVSEAETHARALLALVQEECPQFIGGYVPRPDLEACYLELCEREGWKRRHWTAIARQLGKTTDKKTVRHRGQRFVGYRVPRT